MPAPRKHESLIDKLRALRGELSFLTVYVANEDKATEVAVPNVRERWRRIASVLEELAWERVEALDKKRGIILVHNRGAADERPAAELETLGGTSTGRAAELSALLSVTTNSILRAQEVALERQHNGLVTVMEQQSRLVDSTMRRFEQMDRQYQEMLKVNYALHGERFREMERSIRSAVEQAGAGEGGESNALVEQLLPAFLKAALDKPDVAKAATNGAAKAAKGA